MMNDDWYWCWAWWWCWCLADEQMNIYADELLALNADADDAAVTPSSNTRSYSRGTKGRTIAPWTVIFVYYMVSCSGGITCGSWPTIDWCIYRVLKDFQAGAFRDAIGKVPKGEEESFPIRQNHWRFFLYSEWPFWSCLVIYYHISSHILIMIFGKTCSEKFRKSAI